ncbi:glutamyl-tRNA amidotransferase [Mycolicibacterium vaccae]|uniref:glutamyl-tRNA amidotransferase n=1 Tax=Mycolicibacterium vaccae TaxID=1810 RepID=UPI003D08A822
MTAADHWRATLRTALLAARKDRDTARVSVLRSALSAIDNAETPDRPATVAQPSATIAGAVSGFGTAEMNRRELTDQQIRALLAEEIAERRSAADLLRARGHPDRAAALDAEAVMLADLLRDV